jgi:hypothetical protein
MAFTVEVTSMPLPEVLVAEFRMAFTASWIAAVPLELVELEEADCPRSSLSDWVVEPLSRLDRSELMELVLIPHLLRSSGTRGSGGGPPDTYLIGCFQISLSCTGLLEL